MLGCKGDMKICTRSLKFLKMPLSRRRRGGRSLLSQFVVPRMYADIIILFWPWPWRKRRPRLRTGMHAAAARRRWHCGGGRMQKRSSSISARYFEVSWLITPSRKHNLHCALLLGNIFYANKEGNESQTFHKSPYAKQSKYRISYSKCLEIKVFTNSLF